MHKNQRMPAIFIGHGSPENAFEKNEFSESWKKLASRFPKPKAIIAISAHWTNRIDNRLRNTSVMINERPETIHDFYGFPQHFYDFSYNAPGIPELAEKITRIVKTTSITKNSTWGLDHGTWSVLAQMYPEADIPVIQLGIDEDLPREKLFSIGQDLGALRDEGILIFGSGNIVHNLSTIQWHGKPFFWSSEFDEFVKNSLVKKDWAALIDFEKHPLVKLALPTIEHFLPLLFILGAAKGEEPQFFCEKIFAASLSMRCVLYQ